MDLSAYGIKKIKCEYITNSKQTPRFFEINRGDRFLVK